MIVLVDMDEVIADFERGLVSEWQRRHPDIELFPSGEREAFYIGASHGSKQSAEINSIIHSIGFFENLDPVEGGIDAMQAMTDLGHSVFILTSPGVSYPNAASEKYRWVEKHFGKYMLERLIITPAKPIVRGDILIDDRPKLYAEEKAEWEHVLFDKSYNRDVDGKRRLTWANWREVLPELI